MLRAVKRFGCCYPWVAYSARLILGARLVERGQLETRRSAAAIPGKRSIAMLKRRAFNTCGPADVGELTCDPKHRAPAG